MISVFKNINRFAGRWKWLDVIAIFCARFLIYVLVLCLGFFAVIYNQRDLVIYPLLSGFCAAFIFNKIIYFFYEEARPADLKSTKVLIPVPENPSFPSRHAAMLFGISFNLFFYNMPLAIFFTACSCLVGISRVFCGVHYFRDILGGLVAGLLSSAMIYYLLSTSVLKY